MKDLTLKIPEENAFLNIRVGAIIQKENKILMVHNEEFDYFYSVGGRIQFGETAEEAIVREVYEETGIFMEIERLGFISETFFIGDAEINIGKKIYEIAEEIK